MGVNNPLILRDDGRYKQRMATAGSVLLFKYKDDRNISKEIKDLRYTTRIFFFRQCSVQHTVISSLVRLQSGLCHVSIIHTGALPGSPWSVCQHCGSHLFWLSALSFVSKLTAKWGYSVLSSEKLSDWNSERCLISSILEPRCVRHSLLLGFLNDTQSK
jgi:hypothetical protein